MAAQEAVVEAGVEGGAANGTNSPAGHKRSDVRDIKQPRQPKMMISGWMSSKLTTRLQMCIRKAVSTCCRNR